MAAPRNVVNSIAVINTESWGSRDERGAGGGRGGRCGSKGGIRATKMMFTLAAGLTCSRRRQNGSRRSNLDHFPPPPPSSFSAALPVLLPTQLLLNCQK